MGFDDTDLPGLIEIIRGVVRREIAVRHAAGLPGVVVSYDASEQRATVQPTVRFRYQDEDGVQQTYRPAPIPGVPVLWPTSSGASLTMPLAVGDPVWIEFAQRSIADWLSTGESDVEPRDPRRYDYNDAVCYPAGRPFADPLPAGAYATGATVLRGDDVRLGDATATATVSLSTLTDAQFSALEAVLTAWVPVAGDGGAALKTALTTLISGGWPAATGASKVKAT